jgi:2-methylcitrate dehydratase PrpD
MSTVAETLAEFVCDVSWQDIPADVVVTAKLHLLDSFGAALASGPTPYARSIYDAALALSDRRESTVLCFGTQVRAPYAALANGTLIHGLDFDDTHIQAVYHASAPALAAALAVSELQRSDGKGFLSAFILGMEIGCRLALAAPGAFHDRGLHASGMCASFAAAAVAARLSHDTPPVLVNALGLCGSMAGGIMELRASWLKRLHPGWAAHAGVVAAALARAGFRGPATVFEGPQGFYAAHLGFVPTGKASPVRDLGNVWRVRELAFKPYPCCHLTHAFVDAALYLHNQVGIRLHEIERIDCPLSDRLQALLAEPRELRIRPPTIYDALFSVPYAVALALVRGRVDLAAFYDEPLDDPRVLAISAKTFCPTDAASDYPLHFPGEVRIHLKNGQILARRECFSRGTPERPLSLEEIDDKYFANATRTIKRSRAAELRRRVLAIEDENDIRSLVRLSVRENSRQLETAAVA